MEMDKFYKSILGHRGDITKSLNRLKEAVGKEAGAKYVNFMLSGLETKWLSYEQKWLPFSESYDEDEGYEYRLKGHEDLVDNYHDTLMAASLYVNSLQKPTLPPTIPGKPNCTFKVKLPEIKLKEFYGDSLDWIRFWNQFKSLVDSRQDLDEVTKYTYLTQCIKGSAQSVISGFRGQSSDYEDAVKLLQQTYGNEEKIRRTLIRTFVNLEKPKFVKGEIFAFKVKLENLLMQMSHDSSIDVSKSEMIIREIITMKLPKEAEDFLFNRYQTLYFSTTQIKEGLQHLLDYMKADDKPQHVKQTADKNVQPNPSKGNIVTSPTAIGTYSTTTNNCFFCNGSHKTHDCSQYSTIDARKGKLNAMNRCIKCVRSHRVDDCNTVLNMCPHCKKGKHHSFLCVSSFGKANSSKPTNTVLQGSKKGTPVQKSSPNPNNPTLGLQGDPIATAQVMSIMSRRGAINYSVALPTALVSVRAENGRSVETRCLFDLGSQRSFIHKDLANSLGLKNVAKFDMSLNVFANSVESQSYEIVKPTVRLGNRKKTVIMAVVDRMPDQVCSPGLYATAGLLREEGYQLADDISSDLVENIQLLIGSDFAGRYLSGMASYGNVDLLESTGGYLIYGIIPHLTKDCSSKIVNTTVANVVVDIPLVTDPRTVNSCVVNEIPPIHQLWELEAVGIHHSEESPEDFKATSHYQSTVKYENGRYWVELPFKVNHPCLPNNYKLALAQLHNQRKRFINHPQLLTCYDNIIKEQLQLKFIEEVPNPIVGPSTHYLPHHAVAKESVTTPIRIVYNCSSKASKTIASLNDCLLTGPSLTVKLSDVLVKFRTKQYAYVADIEKAFLQVGLQTHHRDFTRFLWFENPFDENSKINTYRFSSVLFGATCSPFLLQMTLHHHLQQCSSPLANVLLDSFYVDNLQGTTDDIKELLEINDFATVELEKAGMILRQWNSNSVDFVEHFKHTSGILEVPAVDSVLGLNWDTTRDLLSLKPCQFEQLEYVTKRQLLSLVSTCFDPLGMCAPILIKGKILIQAAWKEQIGWDGHLPPQYLEQWQKLAKEFSHLSELKFPRCVCKTGESYTLHVFVDASAKAYGVVCYLSSSENTNFISAKARVAPMKAITLPQLELTALQLGAQYAKYLLSLLREFNIKQVVLWSDSEVALQWVRNNNSNLVYVRNRVAIIRELGSTFQFLHVPTKENPADLVSRGTSVKHLLNSTEWKFGPPWLKSSAEWPVQKANVIIAEIVSEPVPVAKSREQLFDSERCSTFNKLLNVTKYVFHFIQSCNLNISLPEPKIYWLQQVQMQYYPQIYAYLSKKSNVLDKNSKWFIQDLGLYFDQQHEIIRSRGRLHNAVMHDDTKFPVLVPTKSHIAKLLIILSHEKCLHGGVQETLCLVREFYWMPKCRQSIKKVINQCILCKRVEGKRYSYPGPPPLPAERVQHLRPFAHVGVDYSGPITITRTEDGIPHKYYICLFTCTSSRLVHLELAHDMSAVTFVNLFRRFCAAYSSPVTVISDNGTNFVASAKFFEEMLKHPEVEGYMSGRNINWKFIAPRAPWQGGFYERLIGLTKSSLKKVLFKKRVSRDELETILKEIQCKLNNRPLTYIDEKGPLAPLSPAHLLYGRTTSPMPSMSVEDNYEPSIPDHSELNNRYNHISAIIRKFTTMWRKDYLTALREKHYGAQRAVQANPPKIGDIVIVEQSGPQHEWPLGRVAMIYPDSENVIRVVDVLCKDVISKRTVDKLVPLELHSFSSSDDDSSVVSDGTEQDDVPSVVPDQSGNVRTMRQAALRATQLRRNLINNDQL